ncbi:DUF4236 domain-containing protein [Vibrio genomosp. F10]|uniref:DUF4236 domain-containing protein n=1 Tax=Vibrio genomosp. F10 TaxID=723171 RepID=UPI0002E220A6|nr:DUF4236 domain-containing protein [Vibrio genomosp. F10]OEF08372.1 hypothetical protein A1QK_06395 [Vibrio genomosp. F10 str. 9ZD137]
MSFRFFRSFGGRWLRFNISKRGVSCTLGKKGLATATLNSRGQITKNINTPVQGLSYRKTTSLSNGKTSRSSKGLTDKQSAKCDARPFGTYKYNRRELEALHLQAIQRIARLEAQLETNEHSSL